MVKLLKSQNSLVMTSDFGDLFKREYSKLTSRLIKILGPHQFDLAENIAQETLMKAMQVWPLKGIPERPGAWLMTVAKNLAFDHLKRARFVKYDSEALDILSDEIPHNEKEEKIFEDEIEDNLLRMIFICCHPEIPSEQCLALALKSLCGLSTLEIAKAFSAKEEAIAQRIVRAKRLIKDQKLLFEMPEADKMGERLDRVLEVLYLMFNEGYFTHSEENLTREDLCKEALNLCEFLCKNSRTAQPKTFALTALIAFQTSRLKTRKNAEGELLLLVDQDRSLWDWELISKGFHYLNLAATGDELSSYHLQAGIAATHASATSFEETNWKQIVFFYDELIAKSSNPILKLNRGVAIGFKDGFSEGVKALNDSDLKAKLASYYLYFSSLGEMYLRVGDLNLARENFEAALKLNPPQVQKDFLEKRITLNCLK